MCNKQFLIKFTGRYSSAEIHKLWIYPCCDIKFKLKTIQMDYLHELLMIGTDVDSLGLLERPSLTWYRLWSELANGDLWVIWSPHT